MARLIQINGSQGPSLFMATLPGETTQDLMQMSEPALRAAMKAGIPISSSSTLAEALRRKKEQYREKADLSIAEDVPNIAECDQDETFGFHDEFDPSLQLSQESDENTEEKRSGHYGFGESDDENEFDQARSRSTGSVSLKSIDARADFAIEINAASKLIPVTEKVLSRHSSHSDTSHVDSATSDLDLSLDQKRTSPKSVKTRPDSGVDLTNKKERQPSIEHEITEIMPTEARATKAATLLLILAARAASFFKGVLHWNSNGSPQQSSVHTTTARTIMRAIPVNATVFQTAAATAAQKDPHKENTWCDGDEDLNLQRFSRPNIIPGLPEMSC